LYQTFRLLLSGNSKLLWTLVLGLSGSRSVVLGEMLAMIEWAKTSTKATRLQTFVLVSMSCLVFSKANR
jgi:hypothetical protein